MQNPHCTLFLQALPLLFSMLPSGSIDFLILWMAAKSCTSLRMVEPIDTGIDMDKPPVNWCRISQPSTICTLKPSFLWPERHVMLTQPITVPAAGFNPPSSAEKLGDIKGNLVLMLFSRETVFLSQIVSPDSERYFFLLLGPRPVGEIAWASHGPGSSAPAATLKIVILKILTDDLTTNAVERALLPEPRGSLHSFQKNLEHKKSHKEMRFHGNDPTDPTIFFTICFLHGFLQDDHKNPGAGAVRDGGFTDVIMAQVSAVYDSL